MKISNEIELQKDFIDNNFNQYIMKIFKIIMNTIK